MNNAFNITIHSWMMHELHLANNDLIVFSYIYSMQQNDAYRKQNVALADICSDLRLQRQSVERNIKNLLDASLITRRKNKNSYSYSVASDISMQHMKIDGFDFAKSKSKGRKKKYDFKDDDFTAVIANFVALHGKGSEELRDTIKMWVDYKRKKQKSYSPDDLQNQLDRLYDAYKTPREMIDRIKISKSRGYPDITYTNNYQNNNQTKELYSFASDDDKDWSQMPYNEGRVI